MSLHDELKELKKERQEVTDRIYYLMIEVAFIFAIPAFGGLFLGRYLDAQYSDGYTYTIVVLILAFVLSWSLVILRYKQVTKKLKVIEAQISEVLKKLRDEA